MNAVFLKINGYYIWVMNEMKIGFSALLSAKYSDHFKKAYTVWILLVSAFNSLFRPTASPQPAALGRTALLPTHKDTHTLILEPVNMLPSKAKGTLQM